MTRPEATNQQLPAHVRLHTVAQLTTGVNTSRFSGNSLQRAAVIAADDLLFMHGSGELRYATPEQVGTVLNSNTSRINCGSSLNPDFLFFLFAHSPAIKKQLATGAKEGSIVTRVSLAAVKNLLIPLPPLTTQNQIGAATKKVLLLQQQYQRAAVLTEKLLNAVLNTKDWNKQ